MVTLCWPPAVNIALVTADQLAGSNVGVDSSRKSFVNADHLRVALAPLWLIDKDGGRICCSPINSKSKLISELLVAD